MLKKICRAQVITTTYSGTGMAEASAVLACQGVAGQRFRVGQLCRPLCDGEHVVGPAGLESPCPLLACRDIFRNVLERIPDAERAACINTQERVLAEMRKYAEGLESGVISKETYMDHKKTMGENYVRELVEILSVCKFNETCYCVACDKYCPAHPSQIPPCAIRSGLKSQARLARRSLP